MTSYNPENLNEEQTKKLFALWKNYPQISQKIIKINKGVALLLDWMTAVLEYKLKIETLKSAKKKFIDVFF